MALLLNFYGIPVDFPWWFYDIPGGFVWNFWRDAMKNCHGAGHTTTLPGLEKESKHPVPRSDDCPKSVEAEVIFDDSQVVTSPGLEKTSPGLESENRVFLRMTARCPHLPKQGMSLIEALSHAFLNPAACYSAANLWRTRHELPGCDHRLVTWLLRHGAYAGPTWQEPIFLLTSFLVCGWMNFRYCKRWVIDVP